ncbi:DUF3035 domain-containing protein [Yoonia sp. 208BN28-4]|uniref:DUF3035 domain-containing protein n=1 Tax=Yoonia sp. 208BN28-4 TaxID=3126505 RepID=UPI0030B00A39
MRATLLSGLAALALTACTAGDRSLHDLRANSEGPDEFSVVPVAPLVLPTNLNALPEPTPGGSNITDPNPTGDAIVALGGNPARAFAGGIPSSDSALVAAAGRNGVNPAIRAELAAQDAGIRRSAQVLNWFNFLGTDRYFSTYRNQALDAYGELTRFRNLGVATPSAPPLD